MFQIDVPNFVVLDLEVMVEVAAADRSGRAGGQRVFRRERRGKRGSRRVDRLSNKKRQVLCEVRDDTVSGLIWIDTGPGTDYSLPSGQAPGQSRPRREA